MLQTRSRIYFTRGAILKMDGKIDEILDHFYVVVFFFNDDRPFVSRNMLRFSFLSA